MGRAVLIVVRLVAVFLALAALGLILSSALLFYPTTPRLNFDVQNFTSRYDDATGTLHLEGNMTMYVEGMYDVEGARVEIAARNATGFEVLNLTLGPFTLEPQRPRTERVDLRINVRNWIDQGGDPLFRDEELNARFTLRATYATGFMRVAGGVRMVMPWQAPVRQVVVDVTNATANLTGSDVLWSVPYVVETGGFLSGSASVALTLRNATATMATNSTTIPLGTLATGAFNFTLPQSVALENNNTAVTVEVQVFLPGNLSFTITRQVTWRYP
jgi:hypothetical protein